MYMSKIRLEQNWEKSVIRYFEMKLYLYYSKAEKNNNRKKNKKGIEFKAKTTVSP